MEISNSYTVLHFLATSSKLDSMALRQASMINPNMLQLFQHAFLVDISNEFTRDNQCIIDSHNLQGRVPHTKFEVDIFICYENHP